MPQDVPITCCRSAGPWTTPVNICANVLQDNEEHRRLDLQHQIYTMTLGALYPAAPLVRWALRPRQHRRPAIMDVGAGSGSWYATSYAALQCVINAACRAIDVAREFPYCDVVGVDLVPPRVSG